MRGHRTAGQEMMVRLGVVFYQAFEPLSLQLCPASKAFSFIRKKRDLDIFHLFLSLPLCHYARAIQQIILQFNSVVPEIF